MQGDQGDREAEVFQVSNDDAVVAQDKQPKEKTNTDCLVKEQEKEYQTAWKIKTGIQQQDGLVYETNVTLFAKVRCFLIQSGLSKVFWAEDTIRNMSFNESGKYKKTFIASGVGTGSMQVLHGFEFEVEPLGDHTFQVKPQENIDQGSGLQEVKTQDLIDYQLARDKEQHLACKLFRYREDINEAAFAVAAVEKIYAHESLTFNNTVACEVIPKWKAGLKDDMDARSDVYVLSNSCRKCSNDKMAITGGLLNKAKGNVLGMKIIKDQSGNTLRVSRSRFYNGKLVQTLLEGHYILSLEGSLSRDFDVEKNGKWLCIYAVGSQKYQMVCTRLDITSADVGMLDKFDRELQTYVQAAYMTLTEAAKKKIWPKGLLTESRYELMLVAGIATGALVKGGSRSKVPAQVEVVEIRVPNLDCQGCASKLKKAIFKLKEVKPEVQNGVKML
nr:zinc finger, CCHC-type [Tanacetum cinerariifolium]